MGWEGGGSGEVARTLRGERPAGRRRGECAARGRRATGACERGKLDAFAVGHGLWKSLSPPVSWWRRPRSPQKGAAPRVLPGGTGRGGHWGPCDATAVAAPPPRFGGRAVPGAAPDAEEKRCLPPQRAAASIIPVAGDTRPSQSPLPFCPAPQLARPILARREGGRRGDNAARDTGRGRRGGNVRGEGREAGARMPTPRSARRKWSRPLRRGFDYVSQRPPSAGARALAGGLVATPLPPRSGPRQAAAREGLTGVVGAGESAPGGAWGCVME